MTTEAKELSQDEQKSDTTYADVDKIVSSIEEDLLSDNPRAHTAGLEALQLVLLKCEISIPKSIYKLMAKCSGVDVKNLVTRQIQTIVTEALNDSSVSMDIFSVCDDGEDRNHVVGVLCEALKGLPSNILKKLLCDVIFPEMFNTNLDSNVRDTIIDVGFLLIDEFPITNLNSQEIKLFTTKVIERYSKVLENLREQNFCRWHDLWIFLVRFSAKHLHVAMDLANKLLRVVEFAFRNPSYEQRLKGYDCWKELIDNASLDMNHMCSNKQVKLLVTPLKAKFSKMEVVICKRFEIFLYFLEKLQYQSVLCLNEFLEFCFGISNSSLKNGQGKLVPSLWLKSVQVFLAILGDQTYLSAELNRTLFEGPIINENNINRFHQAIISAVIESSIILKQISMDSQKKINITTSLWEALFNILLKSSPEIQEKCFQLIFGSLNTLFKDSAEDIIYIGILAAFTQLLDSSIDYRLISDSLKLLLEFSLKILGEKEVSEEFFKQFSELVQICCSETHITEFLVEQLKKIELKMNEMEIYQIWNIVGSKLMEAPDNDLKTVSQFFLWPIHRLHKFEEQLSVEISSAWSKLFVQVTKKSASIGKGIINDVEKSFKSNPLLSSSIIHLISEIANVDIDFDQEVVNAILKLMSSIMALPLLAEDSAEKLYSLIFKCTNSIVAYAKDDIDSEVVNDICQCVEKLPVHQKNKNLLAKIMISNVDATTSKKLKTLMADLPEAGSHKKASEISSVSNPQEPVNGHSPGNLKRSIRMTQMVIGTPDLNSNKDKVNALQLFGKDVDTMTPLKVKGSLLQNQNALSPINRSKKIINSVKKYIPEPPTFEDQTCNFVMIDTEVKLQKDKLTEHQKEELRRRREDIPALYQDLSQSQTQSSISNDPCLNKDSVEHKASPEMESSKNDFSSVSFVENQELQDAKQEAPQPDDENIYKTDETDVKTENKSSRKSVGKTQKELLRIQMNIVGGDTFFKDLPSKRPRKTVEKSLTIRKKSKKSEPKQDDETDITGKDKTEVPEKESDENSNEDPVEPKIEENVQPATSSYQRPVEDMAPTIPSNLDDSQNSNNRKHKFIKPKKHITTPKSEKKKAILKDTPTAPSTKRKSKNADEERQTKKIKLDKIKTVDKNVSVTSTSGLASESDNVIEQKKSKPKIKTEHKKNIKSGIISGNIVSENLFDSQEGSSQKSAETPEVENKSTKIIGQTKRRPKEIMKKNKEKVRNIQTQLKLANLSNLSQSKKNKGAKLIFIREITNSKNPEKTKVSAAGLKRNKDKKSKNIAYTIESPPTSIDFTSLDLDIEKVQSINSSKFSALEDKSMSAIKHEKSPKRKRASSENSSCVSSTPSPKTDEKLISLNESTKMRRKTIVSASSDAINQKISNKSPSSTSSSQESSFSPIPKRKYLKKSLCSSNETSSPSSDIQLKKAKSPKKVMVDSMSPEIVGCLQENKDNVDDTLTQISSELPELEKTKKEISSEAPQMDSNIFQNQQVKSTKVIKEIYVIPIDDSSDENPPTETSNTHKILKKASIEGNTAPSPSSDKNTSLDQQMKPKRGRKKKIVDIVPIEDSPKKKWPLKKEAKSSLTSLLIEIQKKSEVEVVSSSSSIKMDPTQSEIPLNESSQITLNKEDVTENIDHAVIENIQEASKVIKARKKLKESPIKTAPPSPSRVTRSRASSLSPMITELSSSPRVEPNKGVKSLFTDSEDIIESSQDSLVENGSTSITNLSRIKIKQSPKAANSSLNNGREENMSISTNTDEVCEIIMPNNESNHEFDNSNCVNKSDTRMISQAETETCDSNYEPQPNVVGLDLPEKPELTDSEKLLSVTDTVSIESQISHEDEVIKNEFDVTAEEEVIPPNINDALERPSTPVSNLIEVEFIVTPDKSDRDDLPGSPVGNHTPILTKELLDNTLDISPISSQMTDENNENLENGIEAAIEKAMRDDEISESLKIDQVLNEQPSKHQIAKNLRSTKLLNMVNAESPISRKGTIKKTLSSPALTKSRYEKLFSFVNGNKDDGGKDNKKNDLLASSVSADNLLTFTREVPSPLAIPSSSILKRKLIDSEDSGSPYPKRKRVNFSYPCISSTKLFIRHKEELNTNYRPCFTRSLFGEDFEDDDDESEEEELISIPKYVEQIETEESLEITNSLLLCKKKPIYEQLIDCEESLEQLWKHLSRPMYAEVLKKVLRNKQINTVGDLARLNEVDINRLPFKQPRVKTVRKALKFYDDFVAEKSKKNAELETNTDTSSSGDSEDGLREQKKDHEEDKIEAEIEASKMEATQQCIDVKDEFSRILTKIKDKNIPLEEFGSTFLDLVDFLILFQNIPLEEFGSTFLDLVDESEIISLLKSVYNTDFRKFFNKTHWCNLTESIVQTGGISELFDIISDLAENNHIIADQLENIIQLRIKHNPLKDIISKRTLVDLRIGLEHCIDDGIFGRQDVIQKCIMPLIKSPSDIKSYFDTLTIVQINDLFIQRVQSSDLSVFFDQIREHYGNYTIAQCANKKDVLKICSKEELITTLEEQEDRVQTIKSMIDNISDQSKLVELYSYIGNLIPFKRRIDSHIEFLKIFRDIDDKP
ncbi:hypothetical protein HHI36_006945 [Cryptolaemus montrouzieri]|uniref:Telomere-associated protein RIF1 n=1 Tax=Cryptolaemus montrouzieri TaxID=559131 RepID=A0ABD2MN28_9CUCU